MKLLGLLLLEMLVGCAVEMESGGSITIEHLFGDGSHTFGECYGFITEREYT